jgi:hypothetical protein
MSGKQKKDAVATEQFERLERAILRASAANEAEADAVASSPFLYTRLRARIADEQARRAGGTETWLTLLGVVWRSVPAMALVALFAFILFWTSNFGTATPLSPGVLSDEALMDMRDAGIENVVFAERRALSSDDVLATILQGDEREVSR